MPGANDYHFEFIDGRPELHPGLTPESIVHRPRPAAPNAAALDRMKQEVAAEAEAVTARERQLEERLAAIEQRERELAGREIAATKPSRASRSAAPVTDATPVTEG